MPIYQFLITDQNGKTREITFEGESQEDAVKRLQNRGLFPLQCYGETAKFDGIFHRNDFNVYKFTNRLVPLLQAHVTLERALGIMASGCSREKERDVIIALRNGLHEGKTFSELIRTQGQRFPKIYSNLIEAGEAGGCFETVMVNLRDFLNTRKSQKDFLITSSIYPCVILTVTLGVLVLVFSVFIPRFSQIFLDMGKDLPLLTQILLVFSRCINWLWPLWIIIVIMVIWFAKKVKQGGRMRSWYDKKILAIPVLGRLLISVEINQFIRTLAVLSNNHVHLLKSVQISINIIQNNTIKQSLENVIPELRGGAKLSRALKESNFISPDVIQMLQVGEESGEIGIMLEKIAEESEETVKVEIKRLLALFEPAVIILLALIVLLVVISIFLAIIEMNNI